jgi:hypothetical protein
MRELGLRALTDGEREAFERAPRDAGAPISPTRPRPLVRDAVVLMIGANAGDRALCVRSMAGRRQCRRS